MGISLKITGSHTRKCKNSHFQKLKCKKECISVGCVPSAAVAVSRGVSASWGVSASRGWGCLLPRASASGGMSASGGCVCLVWGVSAWSGGCLPGLGRCLPGTGGVSAWSGGGGIPACTETDPPVNRMTDRQV